MKQNISSVMFNGMTGGVLLFATNALSSLADVYESGSSVRYQILLAGIFCALGGLYFFFRAFRGCLKWTEVERNPNVNRKPFYSAETDETLQYQSSHYHGAGLDGEWDERLADPEPVAGPPTVQTKPVPPPKGFGRRGV